MCKVNSIGWPYYFIFIVRNYSTIPLKYSGFGTKPMILIKRGLELEGLKIEGRRKEANRKVFSEALFK